MLSFSLDALVLPPQPQQPKHHQASEAYKTISRRNKHLTLLVVQPAARHDGGCESYPIAIGREPIRLLL
jgi:hypothetical protein